MTNIPVKKKQIKQIKIMGEIDFSIQLISIHWLEKYDDADDRCAHGQIRIIINNEIIVDEQPDDEWWTLSAAAFHLLRTLEIDHTTNKPVADCLIPSEGHHIDHHKNDPFVHIETAYPMARGLNWWVIHNGNNVILDTENKLKISIPFSLYKQQVLSFVDKVETFYKNSKPKNMPNSEYDPDGYDREGYIKFWAEWHHRRNKWN